MFSLKEAQSWIDGSRLVGDPHYEVQRVCTDSRDAKAGDLFVPLVGERFDAHAFIGQVIGAGVFVGLAWYGIRRDDRLLARSGGAALLLFLLFRMFDWFWQAIPDWLFFLLMGALAFGVLLILRRQRRRQRAQG